MVINGDIYMAMSKHLGVDKHMTLRLKKLTVTHHPLFGLSKYMLFLSNSLSAIILHGK